MIEAREPVISARGVAKRWGHVEALCGVNLDVYAGEIVGLVGDNGAGKSTLLNVICGSLVPDEGDVHVLGQPMTPPSVRKAHELGIEIVYQDLALAPDLSVLDNVFLGHSLVAKGWWGRRLGFLDRKGMAVEADHHIRELGVALPSVRARVDELSGGQRQAVAIARAVMWAKRALLLDEPTAALGVKQAALVDGIIQRAANAGLALLIVSHDVSRVLRLAHRIVVLRQGQVTHTAPASELSLEDVVAAMVGRKEPAAA